jgi:hypothetical protein
MDRRRCCLREGRRARDGMSASIDRRAEGVVLEMNSGSPLWREVWNLEKFWCFFYGEDEARFLKLWKE